jgi:hypothetical protein
LFGGGGNYNAVSLARPSGAAWHHYMITVNRAAGAQQITGVWIDGVSKSLTQVNTGVAGTGGLGNFEHTLMAFDEGAANFGDGAIAEYAIWHSEVLDIDDAVALTAGTLASAITPAPDFYWRLLGVADPETAAIGGVNMTVVGATAETHPFGAAPAVSAASVDINGYDVRITADMDVTGTNGFVVNVGGSPVTIASKIRTGPRKFRYRVANASGPILTGETVTLDYEDTGDILNEEDTEMAEFTGTAVTNGSLQTSTRITFQTGFYCTFAAFSAGERGIYASGRWWTTKQPQSRTPAASGSGASFRNGSMINPASGFGTVHGWDGRASAFHAGASQATFPTTLSDKDTLLLALSIEEDATWDATTAYTVGDMVYIADVFGSGRFFVCSTAGTSDGAEPTWENEPNERDTIADGTVVWTNHGRSPIDRIDVLTFVSSAPAATDFAPAFSDCTKTIHSTTDIDTEELPDWAVDGATDVVEDIRYLVALPHVEIDTSSGGEGGHGYQNQRQYGQWHSESMARVARVLLTDITYATEVLHLAVQTAIDSYGMIESGGVFRGAGGHGHGRLTLAAIGMGLLGTSASWASDMQEKYGELQQCFYVTAADVLARYEYEGDEEYPFPADVQESWLHVPEWGISHAADPTADTKVWVTAYRQCCTARAWWETGLAIRSMGLETALDAADFCDYLLRYRYVQGVVTGNLGTTTTFDANVTDAYGAFAVTSAVLTSGGNKLTITTNRYATGTGTGFVLSDKTLTNFEQAGPRTFTFDVDEATEVNLLSYADTGNFVDASNTELAEFADLAPDEAADETEMPRSPAGWLRRRKLKF